MHINESDTCICKNLQLFFQVSLRSLSVNLIHISPRAVHLSFVILNKFGKPSLKETKMSSKTKSTEGAQIGQ